MCVRRIGFGCGHWGLLISFVNLQTRRRVAEMLDVARWQGLMQRYELLEEQFHRNLLRLSLLTPLGVSKRNALGAMVLVKLSQLLEELFHLLEEAFHHKL